MSMLMLIDDAGVDVDADADADAAADAAAASCCQLLALTAAAHQARQQVLPPTWILSEVEPAVTTHAPSIWPIVPSSRRPRRLQSLNSAQHAPATFMVSSPQLPHRATSSRCQPSMCGQP
ncbi:uncharacterized protein UV8b_03531 [Ustilaginoidea virens]|uniref:Uncharacterized protein n=1 Tax=Ustilaginoidea virens TaxID=1159556 RepID=A0A8E5HQ30_USTVR|nr:uncharacterized protein UV8b_03531 [Ustilaginoidea virens]QUC19290.1 hypothetical protein UV8b_03531 [Ustilaginoidea virens]